MPCGYSRCTPTFVSACNSRIVHKRNKFAGINEWIKCLKKKRMFAVIIERFPWEMSAPSIHLNACSSVRCARQQINQRQQFSGNQTAENYYTKCINWCYTHCRWLFFHRRTGANKPPQQFKRTMYREEFVIGPVGIRVYANIVCFDVAPLCHRSHHLAGKYCHEMNCFLVCNGIDHSNAQNYTANSVTDSINKLIKIFDGDVGRREPSQSPQSRRNCKNNNE